MPHFKISSASVIIRIMKMKTTMRYHFTPVRMVIIEKSTNNKYYRVSCRRKWQPTPVFCLGKFMERGAWWATVHTVAKSWT